MQHSCAGGGTGMIAAVISGGRRKTVAGDGDSVTVTVFQCPLRVIRIAERTELRMPREIRLTERKECFSRIIFLLARGEETAQIDVYQTNAGFSEYRCLKPEHSILSIGGHIEDDFFLRDELLPAHAVRIDLLRGTVSAMDHTLFADGVSCTEAEIRPDTVYEVLSMRFLVQKHFLFVNSCGNCLTALSRSAPLHEVCTVGNVVPVRWQTEVLPPRETGPLAVSFPPPVPEEPGDARSLFFMAAPSALMAGAAAISVLLTSGARMSAFLMPGAMIFTSCILLPLQHFLEKRKRKKAVEEKHRLRAQRIEEEIRAAENRKAERIRQLEERFVRQDVLKERLSKRILPSFDLYDPDFLTVRLGICETGFSCRIRGGTEMDSICRAAEEEICRPLAGPCLVNLETEGCMAIVDPEGILRNIILMQLVLERSPADLKLVFLADAPLSPVFRHLPHARICAPEMYEKPAGRYVIICFRTDTLQRIADDETVLLFLREPEEHPRIRTICVLRETEGILLERRMHRRTVFRPEPLFLAEQRVFPMLSAEMIMPQQDLGLTFFGLGGVSYVKEFGVADRWEKNRSEIQLSAYCGRDEYGHGIMLNLSADGPHGLLAGTTGSGKSEFLLSMLLSLCIRYSPQDFSTVIFDFKGGGLLQSLSAGGRTLPHLAGALTNLDDYAMERALCALRGICRKRESLFRRMHAASGAAVGDLASYRTRWKQEYGLPYIGHLLIAVDEFAEMKKEHPAFLEELVTIARVGRSLGIHLLLATQKPAGVISEQIRANMGFRICLRVQDASDSMEVLQNRCAAELHDPGSFWLRTAHGMIRGQAAYAGGPASGGTELCCYDMNGRCICTKSAAEEQITQREAVILELSRQAENMHFRTEPLWTPSQRRVTADELAAVHAIGILDDFPCQKWRYIRRKPLCAVWSTDRSALHDFLHVIVQDMICSAGAEDEIYIIGERECCYEGCRQFSAHLRCDETERIGRLNRRLLDGGNAVRCIVIEDAEGFLSADERHTEMLHEWIRRSADLHLQIAVAAGTSADLRYRDLAYIRQRFVLTAQSAQEASAVLEVPVKPVMMHGRAALTVCRQEALQMHYPQADHAQIARFCAQMRGEAAFRLWKMPERISVLSNSGRVKIGVSYRTGTEIILSAGSRILIVAMDTDILHHLHALLSPSGFPIILCEEERAADGIWMLTEEQYGRLRPQGDLLFAGPWPAGMLPYRLQYHEELRPGDGLLVRGSGKERIRIVNAI